MRSLRRSLRRWNPPGEDYDSIYDDLVGQHLAAERYHLAVWDEKPGSGPDDSARELKELKELKDGFARSHTSFMRYERDKYVAKEGGCLHVWDERSGR